MQRTLVWITLMVSIAGCAAAHAQPAASAPATAPSGGAAADAVLDTLKARGQGLKDFSADVSLTETDSTTQLSNERTGRAWYQSKADGDARLRVTLDQRKTGNRTVQEKNEYLLDDGWLVDRNYRKNNETRRQVQRPGEKVNLLKLGEGPFPLPIGQDREEVYKQFDVTLMAAKQDDPANTSHLKLVPKAGTRLAKKFSQIDVSVAGDGMPVRIATLDVNGEVERRTDLSNVKINGGLTDAAFKLDAIDEKEWDLHSEAYQE